MRLITPILRISIALYLGYICFSALQVSNIIPESKLDSYAYTKKLDKIWELSRVHKAEKVQDSALFYTSEYQSEIVSKGNLILDSTIIGAGEEEGRFYVKVGIGNDWYGTVVAKLDCEEGLYKDIRRFDFKNVLLVADINKIDCSECDVIALRDGEQILVDKSKDILLTGQCIEAVQLASF